MSDVPIHRHVPTFTAMIFVAGDIGVARQICREFCRSGLCVTIESTEYIYTGGAEAGVRIGLLNYPRFPADPDEILNKAFELAEMLRDRLCQHSSLVVTPTSTHWVTTRAAP